MHGMLQRRQLHDGGAGLAYVQAGPPVSWCCWRIAAERMQGWTQTLSLNKAPPSGPTCVNTSSENCSVGGAKGWRLNRLRRGGDGAAFAGE